MRVTVAGGGSWGTAPASLIVGLAAPAVDEGVPVISVVEVLGAGRPVGVRSGPNLAREVVAGPPSVTVVAYAAAAAARGAHLPRVRQHRTRVRGRCRRRQQLTFLGLAGNGDLIATCSSPQSRDRTVGPALAAGRSLDEVQAEMHMVADGVRTAPVVLAVAEQGVEMPITEQVEAVLHRGADPRHAVGALMGRDPEAELDGLT